MATRDESENVPKPEANKSDWDLDDDEDDNWDDWGDAEDDTPTEPQQRNADQGDENENNNIKDSSTTTTLTTPTTDTNDNKELTHREEKSVESSSTTSPQDPKAGWSGMWGGVVSSVLSTATEGLGNITSTVSQGINQIIGVPDPEEMARINVTEEAKTKILHEDSHQSAAEEDESNSSTPTFGLSLVSGVTTLGSKVLNTGLDTLEGIGKKTMDILQENDPLLKNKRKLLGLDQERPNLSQVLREAKKDADRLEDTLKELKMEKDKAQLRFEILFENNCGLVHLEALEILSKESELKLQKLQESVSGKALEELQETVHEVKELMELEDIESESEQEYDDSELSVKFSKAIEDTDLKITFDDIAKTWLSATAWLESEEAVEADAQTLFAKGITTLAESCALEMLKLHKIAELLLVKEHHSTANEVDGIVQLCKQFNIHLHGIANRYGSALSKHTEEDEARSNMSKLFAEMLIARQHIKKAFQLFLPILQIGAV